MRRPLAHAGTLLPFALVLACHDRPVEPPQPAAPDASHGIVHHQIHRIVQEDHRHMIELVQGDGIVLPSDPAFDWSIDFEDKSSFKPFARGDAGGTAFEAVKAGIFRIMVFGDPKCLKLEGGCGTSKRRWDVTAHVS